MEREAHIDPVDVALAVSASVLDAAAGTTRRVWSTLHPVAGMVLRPRLLPRDLQPGRWLEGVTREGGERRAALRAGLLQRLDELVPVVLSEVLSRAHLTDLVLRYVDLDRVVSAVDLDAAAARLDVSAVVERVEVDPIAERLDLDAVLDRLDLTSLVLQRVDLDVLVQAILDRIDLVGLAAEVIDGVDLPEIIRESTGSMASDTVRGVRMQGIVADEAVGRAVDRLLLRRGHRSTRAPTAPDELSSGRETSSARGDLTH